MARISVDQACARLGISKSTFYGHVRAGRVSIYKDGARSFVHEAGLVALEGGQDEPQGRPISPEHAARAAEDWRAAVAEEQAAAERQRAADIERIAAAVAAKLKG